MKQIKNSVLQWFRNETVLVAAWILALLSMLFIPPDAVYLTYFDLHTLGLLFCLMAVMTGLQKLGLFHRMAAALLNRLRNGRQLELVLVMLCFFSSMLITNDVALITFVPFAIEILRLAGRENRMISVVVLQTIAANLGSMTTPIGNPQNIYLYSRYNMDLSLFLSATLPFSLLSLVLLLLLLLRNQSYPVKGGNWSLASGEEPASNGVLSRNAWLQLLYALLFLLCLACVAKWLPVIPLVLVTLTALILFDHSTLPRIDYSLLLTFCGFFIFIGNLGRVPAFTDLFERLLKGNEFFCALISSQLISNVPAALLLSGFTENGAALLSGTNVGGLGTLIASMASLISYKYFVKACPEQKGHYFNTFTVLNLLFLAALILLYFFL